MERINSTDLQGANAYFTNFDHRIVKATKDKEKLQKSVERVLKILLLTKNNVACAASHLTSEFTYKIFKDNPILLGEGMVLPSLRKDKVGFESLFETQKMKAPIKNEMSSFYSDKVKTVISWDLLENSNWFRDKFLSNLKLENSVIRKNYQDYLLLK